MAKRKKLSLKQKNPLRTYLNDEEHLKFLKRMHESGILSQAGYMRLLIIRDFGK